MDSFTHVEVDERIRKKRNEDLVAFSQFLNGTMLKDLDGNNLSFGSMVK